MSVLNVWLCQSNYSFLQGASHPAELIKRAARLGWGDTGVSGDDGDAKRGAKGGGLAFTDFDGVYGLVQAYRAQRTLHAGPMSRHKSDILPEGTHKETSLLPAPRIFYGAQLLVECGAHAWGGFTHPDATPYQGDAHAPTFLQNRVAFIATHARAYAALCRMVTYSHRHSKTAEPINPNDPLAPWPREAIAIVPGRGVSQLFSPRQTRLFDHWLEFLAHLQARHGPLLHLALTPPTSPLETNAFLNHLEASRLLGIPCVATGDVFFHSARRKHLWDVLQSIRLLRTLPTNTWACFPNAERTFHRPSYYTRFFTRPRLGTLLEEALAANQSLASYVTFCVSELKYHYPQEFIPAGHTPLSYLTTLVEEAIRARYVDPVPTRIRTLVDKEVGLIGALGFADYFLTVWDITQFAVKARILFQGRGSAANSCVCFLLGITAVDPMVSDMLFERFISRERGEPPDIDVDFEHERREEVIQYIYSRYSRERAAMVANVISFRTRGALRSVGKALGFSESAISDLLSRSRVDRSTLKKPMGEIISSSQLIPLDDARLDVWAKTAQELKGFPRHLGVHSGGFVISNGPLCDLSPIEPATMEGRSVIQWNKDDLEYLGLFKIDVLALGMLTALRKTFDALKSHRKYVPGTLIPLSLATLPPECPKTYAMICAAKTTGVFQIESRAQMSMLPRVLPQTFYDLVVEVGLVRPGPIVSGIVQKYVKRRQGQEAVHFPDEKLRPILERTLGVPIFQEQVMRIAIAVGDFSPGEADELRRAMGQWKLSGEIHMFREKLFSGMQKNNIPLEFAEQIYKQIEGFSEYGFPESHATSFAYLVYASCYLRAHYHVYFLCGLLNSQPLGFYSVHSLLQDASLAGVKLEAPCILRSQWDSYVTPEGVLQLGFRVIELVRKDHASAFVTERDACAALGKAITLHSAYALLDAFFAPEKVSLVVADCFRGFDINRRNILWELLARPSALFDDVEKVHFAPKTGEFEAWDNMIDDFAQLHTSLAAHPMTLVRQIAWPFEVDKATLTSSQELHTKPDRSQVTVAGLLMVRQSPPTAKGMVFITLEDENGTVNLVIRPNIYEKYRATILAHSILCVRGQRQHNGPSSSTVLVNHVFPMVSVQKALAQTQNDWSDSIAPRANDQTD